MILFSRRFHKTGRSIRPDPTVDHIMVSLGGDTEATRKEETSGMVTLMVRSDDSPLGHQPIDLNLNGVNYQLPRDTLATIPKELADILLNAANIKTRAPATDHRGRLLVHSSDRGNSFDGFQEIDQSRWRVDIERMD